MTSTELSLDPQTLLNEATERTGGLTDLGKGPFVEPLTLFTNSLETEARLNAVGRMIAKERILGHAVLREPDYDRSRSGERRSRPRRDRSGLDRSIAERRHARARGSRRADVSRRKVL